MIARDRNHPSVILWSVSNETQTQREDVRQDNESLIRRARALDPTRLCVHVSNKPDIAPFFDEDDVICVNRYPSKGSAMNAADPADLAEAAARWRADLVDLHERYPAKPILVTEFGYMSFAGCRGLPHGEDVHAHVLAIEFEALRALPQVCGAAIWCWADHAWPKQQPTKKAFHGTLVVSPYGCLTRDRRELEAYREACRLFAAEPEADEPLPEECP
jgi:beta-glucuronidase